jgi:hypothetical protein
MTWLAFKKNFAAIMISIITVVLIGAGAMLLAHESRIGTLEVKGDLIDRDSDRLYEDMNEIKRDIKTLLQRSN